MIFYEKEVQKAIKKGDIPKQVIKLFHHAFQSLDLTKDLNLFDIKKLKGSFKRDYFRLRKGKYRAIFFIEDNNFYIIYIGKRDEVYESWGVTSVRLNQKEEKLLKLLKNYYNCDASSLLKRSLYELYEDLKDKEIIENFEKKEKTKKPQFVSFDELI